MNKIVASAEEAVDGIPEGAVIMVGGFGPCGIPENMIRALAARGTKNLTLISNNAGNDVYGIGLLIKNGQVKKMIMSYGGNNKTLQQMALEGRLEIEWTPQGTLAERIRAAGAGLGGFYTPTGYGTLAALGKETREISGRWYVLEKPLRADFALIKASLGDQAGNLFYRRTTRNFNPVMATAARAAIAEVENLVETGKLESEHIHTPGIYIKKIFQGRYYEKTVEFRTVRQKTHAG